MNFWLPGLAVLAVACQPAPGPVKTRPTPWKAAAIAHAGASTPAERSDGPRAAVDAALAVLEAGGDPMDAVVAGVKVLEDDPRFNAGTGSRVRIDGETVQMDASIMHSNGRFGAVAVIEDVRNPIEVAHLVEKSPHLVIGGDGATRFAQAQGIPTYSPLTEDRRKQALDIQRRLREGDEKIGAWSDYEWQKAWNFEKTLSDLNLDAGSDTVGVAVRTVDGHFAVGLSSGGTSITLRGRVGDVPIYGAGLYAGSHGAVAATGEGERIIEYSVGRTTHQALVDGLNARASAQRTVDALADKGSIGLIVLTPDGMSAAANRDMAWAGREAGSKMWWGPEPKNRP